MKCSYCKASEAKGYIKGRPSCNLCFETLRASPKLKKIKILSAKISKNSRKIEVLEPFRCEYNRENYGLSDDGLTINEKEVAKCQKDIKQSV